MSATDTTEERPAKLKMAHVLFMDIGGYSKLPMDHQEAVLRTLQEVVSSAPVFLYAEASNEVIRLPYSVHMTIKTTLSTATLAQPKLPSRPLANQPERRSLPLALIYQRKPSPLWRGSLSESAVVKTNSLITSHSLPATELLIANPQLDFNVSHTKQKLLTISYRKYFAVSNLPSRVTSHGSRVTTFLIETQGLKFAATAIEPESSKFLIDTKMSFLRPPRCSRACAIAQKPDYIYVGVTR